MRLSSLILFTLVLILVLNTLYTFGKIVKVTTTGAVLPATTKVVALVQTPRRKFGIASNIQKKKKKKRQLKKNKKSTQILWKLPDTNQKKIFNDYKMIIYTKIKAYHPNLNRTSPLEPMKYRLQTTNADTLHHYLIKLPNLKYTRAVIHIRKGMSTNENSISVSRTMFDDIVAAEG